MPISPSKSKFITCSATPEAFCPSGACWWKKWPGNWTFGRRARWSSAPMQGWPDGEIRHTREEKAQTTGLFRERVFLEKVIEE